MNYQNSPPTAMSSNTDSEPGPNPLIYEKRTVSIQAIAVPFDFFSSRNCSCKGETNTTTVFVTFIWMKIGWKYPKTHILVCLNLVFRDCTKIIRRGDVVRKGGYCNFFYFYSSIYFCTSNLYFISAFPFSFII